MPGHCLRVAFGLLLATCLLHFATPDDSVRIASKRLEEIQQYTNRVKTCINNRYANGFHDPWIVNVVDARKHNGADYFQFFTCDLGHERGRWAYIHIYKCAGSSIQSVLSKACVHRGGKVDFIDRFRHEESDEKYETWVRDELQKFTLFTAVRNPFSRFASSYFEVFSRRPTNDDYFKRVGKNADDLMLEALEVLADKVPEGPPFHWTKSNGDQVLEPHFIPQILYLMNHKSTFENLQYILRMETLDQDLPAFLEFALGASVEKVREILSTTELRKRSDPRYLHKKSKNAGAEEVQAANEGNLSIDPDLQLFNLVPADFSRVVNATIVGLYWPDFHCLEEL